MHVKALRGRAVETGLWDMVQEGAQWRLNRKERVLKLSTTRGSIGASRVFGVPFVSHESYRLALWAMTLEISPRREGAKDGETIKWGCRDQRSYKISTVIA